MRSDPTSSADPSPDPDGLGRPPRTAAPLPACSIQTDPRPGSPRPAEDTPRLTGLNVVRPRAGAPRALHIDPAAAPGVDWHPSGGNSRDGAGNDHLNLAIGAQGDSARRRAKEAGGGQQGDRSGRPRSACQTFDLPATGNSVPLQKVTARRSHDARYPPNCWQALRVWPGQGVSLARSVERSRLAGS